MTKFYILDEDGVVVGTLKAFSVVPAAEAEVEYYEYTTVEDDESVEE